MSLSGQRPKAEPRSLLALLAVAEFMLTLDLSIVNVALPSIRDDLGFSRTALQWIVNGYGLTFAGFLLFGGRATDIFGGRRVFLGALGSFSIASLACGVAGSPEVLVGSRVIQGVAAGLLAPATLSILTTSYAAPDARNRALAIWSGVAIGGGATGALLGGILTSTLSWRWIFFINVPIGASVLVVSAARLPRPRASIRGRLDVPGAVAVTGSLLALMFGVTRSSDLGWGSTEVVGAMLAAAALASLFAVIEMRFASPPLVPFRILRLRPIWAGNLLSFLSFLPVMATWFFLTLYLQEMRNYTSLQTGVLFLPLSLAVIAGSQISFRLVRAAGERVLLVLGGLSAAGGVAWLSGLSPSTGMASIIASATLTMAGGGLMFGPITVAATSAGPNEAGLASGLLNTTRQIGGALGLAALTTIATASGTPTAGYATAFRVAAVIFIGTAIAGVLVMPRGRRSAARSPAKSARVHDRGAAA
jgi:EmrB/QacA subfamily drug resistance transporter